MRVVVTGGMGRLARWIVREIGRPRNGRPPHHVTIFDRRQGRALRGVPAVRGDHEDLRAVRTAVAGAEVILHLSASHLSPEHRPAEVFRSNLLGVFNVHEAARLEGVRRVVSWSSVAALGWSGANHAFVPDYLPIDEDHPLRATDAYGLSKAAGEDISRAFAERYGLETIALRHVWTVTPLGAARMWRDGGKRQGAWIHYAYLDVRDAADAARRALEVPMSGHATMYLAADDSAVPIPLSDLLPRLRPAVSDTAAALRDPQAAISNARAKAFLGWQPRYSWRRRPSLMMRARLTAEVIIGTARDRTPRTLRRLLRPLAAAVGLVPRRPPSRQA